MPRQSSPPVWLSSFLSRWSSLHPDLWPLFSISVTELFIMLLFSAHINVSLDVEISLFLRRPPRASLKLESEQLPIANSVEAG